LTMMLFPLDGSGLPMPRRRLMCWIMLMVVKELEVICRLGKNFRVA
jgi:hypothetical protein